jgi:hypothetical protein
MYIKELAVFGLSTIEMVHDVSFVQQGKTIFVTQQNCFGFGTRVVTLIPGSCLDAAPLAELSLFLVKLDIELSLYFPLDSFLGPAGKSCTDLLMNSLARCDAVFVPGGDGSTPLQPADLFATTKELRDAVLQVHNGTRFFVSLQQCVKVFMSSSSL